MEMMQRRVGIHAIRLRIKLVSEHAMSEQTFTELHDWKLWLDFGLSTSRWNNPFLHNTDQNTPLRCFRPRRHTTVMHYSANSHVTYNYVHLDIQDWNRLKSAAAYLLGRLIS